MEFTLKVGEIIIIQDRKGLWLDWDGEGMEVDEEKFEKFLKQFYSDNF